MKNIENIIKNLFNEVGFDYSQTGRIETPKRYAKFLIEFLNNKNKKQEIEKIKTFFETNNYNGMITLKDIEFFSLCEHHLLPFFGTVKIGYIPKGKIIGLSKLARTVKLFAKEPQTQEYLTEEIAEFLFQNLKCLGVGVIINARHLCMEMRGVKTKGFTKTVSLKGVFLQGEIKNEFIKS